MADTPSIYNVEMTTADTEYSQQLSSGAKKFLIHTRDGTKFRLAFESGKVASPTEPYFTVGANGEYYEDHVRFVNEVLTLYFACASAAKTVEIIEWV